MIWGPIVHSNIFLEVRSLWCHQEDGCFSWVASGWLFILAGKDIFTIRNVQDVEVNTCRWVSNPVPPQNQQEWNHKSGPGSSVTGPLPINFTRKLNQHYLKEAVNRGLNEHHVFERSLQWEDADIGLFEQWQSVIVRCGTQQLMILWAGLGQVGLKPEALTKDTTEERLLEILQCLFLLDSLLSWAKGKINNPIKILFQYTNAFIMQNPNWKPYVLLNRTAAASLTCISSPTFLHFAQLCCVWKLNVDSSLSAESLWLDRSCVQERIGWPRHNISAAQWPSQ